MRKRAGEPKVGVSRESALASNNSTMKLSIETHSAFSAINSAFCAIERVTFFSPMGREYSAVALHRKATRTSLENNARACMSQGRKGLVNFCGYITQVIEAAEDYGFDVAAGQIEEIRDEFFAYADEYLKAD